MAQDFDDVIEQIRVACPIEDVIAETPGFSLTGHGRNRSTREHDSLVIDTENGRFRWYSRGERGDVYQWVQNRQGWDFKAAVEALAKRAGIAAPAWGSGSPEMRMERRTRQDIFEIGQTLFEEFLWSKDGEAAVQYCKNRGWSEATIKSAELGFAGDQAQGKDLRAELRSRIVAAGGDPECAAAVSLLGFGGDVKRWCKDHEISDEDGAKWIENGYIGGLIGKDLLVYPHNFSGRTSYFSGRRVHYSDEDKAKNLAKTYNLNKLLVGSKVVYPNWIWSRSKDYCVLVEGQANAITLGQWGIPAISLMGLESEILNETTMRLIGARNDKHEVQFTLALDSDAAGRKNTGLITGSFERGMISDNLFLRLFGPKLRVMEWAGIAGVDTFVDLTDADHKEREVTDANDLLRGMML